MMTSNNDMRQSGRNKSRVARSSVGRISIEHVAAALRKAQSLDLPQKATLLDEIHLKQPNLLAPSTSPITRNSHCSWR